MLASSMHNFDYIFEILAHNMVGYFGSVYCESRRMLQHGLRFGWNDLTRQSGRCVYLVLDYPSTASSMAPDPQFAVIHCGAQLVTCDVDSATAQTEPNQFCEMTTKV